MKEISKNKSHIIPVTVFCTILAVLCVVSLYYMQYDLSATNWIYVFFYVILTVTSVAALIQFTTVKNRAKLILATGLIVLNAINLIGSVVFAISGTNYFTLITAIATSLFSVFALSYTDSLATGINFNKSIIYNIVVFAIGAVPAILSIVLKQQVYKNYMLAVMYTEAIIIFAAGIILTTVSIIKGKRNTFLLIYGTFCLAMLASNILNIISTSRMQSLLHVIICLTLAFMVPTLISDSVFVEEKKKKGRK